MRDFLRSAGLAKLKRNHIRWKVVCLPTKEGGMGIRRIHEQNEASFIKLAWTVTSSNSLWAKWVASRYFRDSAVLSQSTPTYASCIWRKIRNSAHQIPLGSKWIIGDGKSANIWFDSWAKEEALAPLFTSFPFPVNQQLHFHLDGSNWVIPLDILEAAVYYLRNAALNISLDEHSADRLVWKSHPYQDLSF